MTTILARDEDDVEILVERLLETRDRTKKAATGEITVGEDVCTLNCTPKSTRDSLLREYYSWLRTHSQNSHR